MQANPNLQFRHEGDNSNSNNLPWEVDYISFISSDLPRRQDGSHPAGNRHYHIEAGSGFFLPPHQV